MSTFQRAARSAQGAFRVGKKRDSAEPGAGGEEEDVTSFTCERVCTSNRLLKRLGSLAKEPVSNTCVTVCGTSGVDACNEACQRAVCVNMHQVPAWNDQCLKRCTQECIRGRT
ncbi:hypothetical protein CYMTET_21530 [Cymbomonas tetramitiformis]|uniref:Uncharacterized protein n=1 Tax=Cymbomonas tetramitiformis TaxID=36881 RepID=A0AAE0L2S9_9CHLO|nr:hypothetical protein CYMTET_21530 [Cymbomonas tetramitiformis]